MYYASYDWSHWLYVMLPVLALTLLVQLFLKATYAKWSQVGSQGGLTGAQTAERILREAGIDDVRVELVDGFLSDHYDPREHVLRLSQANYEGTSIAAIGVAAHEVGHAIQHATAWAPMKLRNLAVPMANFGNPVGLLVLIVGMVIHSSGLIQAGFFLMCGILLFQLVNLPVEFDASRRALEVLPRLGILSGEENRGARNVLAAAALTYVAGVLASAWELLYLAMRLGLLGDRRSNDRS